MKRKLLMFALVFVLVFSVSSTALAAGLGRGGGGMGRGGGRMRGGTAYKTEKNATYPGLGLGICGGGYAFMWDEDGNFLDKEAFEAKIDQAIADGLIASEDKAALLETYDWCAAYGGGAIGGRRGPGCGRFQW